MLTETRLAQLQQETAALIDNDAPRYSFWLSFADETDGFLGVCVIDEAVNFFHAILLSKTCRCNPGGEVLASQLDQPLPLDVPRFTLLSRKWLQHYRATHGPESL